MNREARDYPSAADPRPFARSNSPPRNLCRPYLDPARAAKYIRQLAIELPGLERAPNILAPVRAPAMSLRCCVGRDYDPVQGKWYQDLEENEIFQVLSVDPDEEIIELQYENGDIEEIDLDTWHELDLEHAEEPEGWAADDDDDDEEEEEDEDDLDEDDDDWDEDEDDDWDEDEDDDLDDDDYSDRDDM